MAPPSPHLIFNSAYLLGYIFGQLQEDDSEDARHPTLAKSARVCKLWSRVALPLLWADIHLETLFETLGRLQRSGDKSQLKVRIPDADIYL